MRIEPRAPGAYPAWLRPFFASQRRRYGAVLLPGLLWGRVPKLFAAVALLWGALDRRGSPLPPALRSLVTVRVSQLVHCRFCVDLNAMMLAERTGSTAQLEALLEAGGGWRDSALFDARARAALDYAEAMTEAGRGVTDAHVAALRPHFDDDAIVELTGLVAFQNLSARFNAALDVPAQGFCRLPGAGGAP
jgi:AhpD family alkylhydroperoxidase